MSWLDGCTCELARQLWLEMKRLPAACLPIRLPLAASNLPAGALATDREKRGEHKAYITAYSGAQERRCGAPIVEGWLLQSSQLPLQDGKGGIHDAIPATTLTSKQRCAANVRSGVVPAHSPSTASPAATPRCTSAASHCCSARARAAGLARTSWSASW